MKLLQNPELPQLPPLKHIQEPASPCLPTQVCAKEKQDPPYYFMILKPPCIEKVFVYFFLLISIYKINLSKKDFIRTNMHMTVVPALSNN